MLRAIAAVTALLAAAVIAAAPAVAEPAKGGVKNCKGKHVEGTVGWSKLKAKNVSCGGARKIADHFVFKADGIDDRFHDWLCIKAQLGGNDEFTVHCAREFGGRDQEADFVYKT
jgi:hypothetical protein